MENYNIGTGDYYGDCKANEIFNKTMVPEMKGRLKLDDETIESLVRMFENIYDCGYNDGYMTCSNEINDF